MYDEDDCIFVNVQPYDIFINNPSFNLLSIFNTPVIKPEFAIYIQSFYSQYNNQLLFMLSTYRVQLYHETPPLATSLSCECVYDAIRL
jgi:hypothetical protein